MEFLLLYLTCANSEEAQKITDALLEAKLVACVKIAPVTSHFVWEGAQESAREILLMMETLTQNYDAIYGLVKKLHSYKTFVLQGVSIVKVSKDVEEWIKDSCQQDI